MDLQTSNAPFSHMRLLPRARSMGHAETALREYFGYLCYRLLKPG